MTNTHNTPVYLDNHATTPVDPRVLERMLPYFTEVFGNASSTDHEHGAAAHTAVERARLQVARAVGADAKEIVFTSGATESINLAIIGVAEERQHVGKHIVTSAIEHPAVLDTCRHLESRGWEVTYVPVDSTGLHAPAQFEDAIRADTVLVSVMMANNEIGVIQPVRQIAAAARAAGALFHTDATQAIATLGVDVRDLGVDLLSFSSHKIYGPKGVGALFARRTYPRVRVAKQAHGGGHERGIRSGTLNVPGIVGFGEAAALVSAERSAEATRLRRMRDALLEGLSANVDGVEVNGDMASRLPSNLNVAFMGVEARSLLAQVRSAISVSLGSACATGSVTPSHVIQALGLGDTRAHTSMRFGFGRFNRYEDVEICVDALRMAVTRVRALHSA